MRGISLETVIGLIIAIIAAGIIVFIIFSTGLMANFMETLAVFEIMISAYIRIAVVNALNVVMWAVALIIMIVLLISLFKGLRGASKIIAKYGKVSEEELTTMQKFQLKMAHNFGGNFNYLAQAIFISYILFVSFVFSHIPFYGTTINVHLGSDSHPYNTTLVNEEIANRIDTAWKIMGGGMGNPLEGISDKPNPFPVFVIFPHFTKGNHTNMSNVYNTYVKKYGKPNFDIYVFCNVSKGIIGKLNPTEGITCDIASWVTGSSCDSTLITEYPNAGKCIIDNNSEVFIEYGDTFTGGSLGSGPPIGVLGGPRRDRNCPYFQGVGDLNKDVIVICIKEIK